MGKPVRIICYDRVDTAYPIIALIKSYNGENCFSYDINGKLAHHDYNNEDLVIIEEVECSKFNVGDWVFMNTHGSQPWLVIKVTPNYYEIKDSSGYITAKSHHTTDSGTEVTLIELSFIILVSGFSWLAFIIAILIIYGDKTVLKKK